MRTMIINPLCGHTCDENDGLWYIYPYWQQIYDYVKNKIGTQNTLYFEKEQAVKDVIWTAHDTFKPDVVIATGHGNYWVYTGYKLNTIYITDMREQGFKKEWAHDKTFLVLSCRTAKELGKYFINPFTLGAKYYLGWDEDYVILVVKGRRKGSHWYETPDLLFLKPIEEAFEKVGAGEWSAEQAYEYIRRKYEEHLNNPEIPDDCKKWIEWDLKHMKLLKREELKFKYVIKAYIPKRDGTFDEVVLAQGEDWYVYPYEYAYDITIPEKDEYVDEGDGKIKVIVELVNAKGRGEAEVKVKFKREKVPPEKEYEVKVTIELPKEGQVLKYGKTYLCEFKVEIKEKS